MRRMSRMIILSYYVRMCDGVMGKWEPPKLGTPGPHYPRSMGPLRENGDPLHDPHLTDIK